tara:strand:- start:10 stop:261 length:252 start_codon:yes stop_codon:yes gene_type:complete
MNFLQCCSQRKSVPFPNKIEKEEKIYCSRKNCNNRVYISKQVAVVGDNKYYFCQEKCYYDWLKENLLSALRNNYSSSNASFAN